MIITAESKELYQEFRFLDLNDNLQKTNSSIIDMVKDSFKNNRNLYINVMGFLRENKDKILSKLDNENKNKYQKIWNNFYTKPSSIDLIHLNQMVNQLIKIKYD